MSNTFPVIKGKIGSTEYYQATVGARTLATMVKTAAELKAWTEFSVFERFQRELAFTRIKKEIAPYLVRSRDRFFGAFIILVFDADLFEFEPAEIRNIPAGKAYADASQLIGFLTVDGGDLVALDGQHRLQALREVLESGDDYPGEYRDDVLNDQFSIILIKHETFEKTRRIFNKVNRHAKPTSNADNIITSEDDGYAIVTRWLVEPTPPLRLKKPEPPLNAVNRRGPLIEFKKTSLVQKDHHITTITQLEKTVRTILEANGITKFSEKDTVNRPSDAKLKKAYKHAAHWWNRLIYYFRPLHEALESEDWKIRRLKSSGSSSGLLFVPIAQQALFEGIARAFKRGLELDRAMWSAARLDWSRGETPLYGIIVGANGAALSRGVKLAGRLIEYLIVGEQMLEEEKDELLDDIRIRKDDWEYRLPDPGKANIQTPTLPEKLKGLFTKDLDDIADFEPRHARRLRTLGIRTLRQLVWEGEEPRPVPGEPDWDEAARFRHRFLRSWYRGAVNVEYAIKFLEKRGFVWTMERATAEEIASWDV
jgi:DNA sulfur modification protein DndB